MRPSFDNRRRAARGEVRRSAKDHDRTLATGLASAGSRQGRRENCAGQDAPACTAGRSRPCRPCRAIDGGTPNPPRGNGRNRYRPCNRRTANGDARADCSAARPFRLDLRQQAELRIERCDAGKIELVAPLRGENFGEPGGVVGLEGRSAKIAQDRVIARLVRCWNPRPTPALKTTLSLIRTGAVTPNACWPTTALLSALMLDVTLAGLKLAVEGGKARPSVIMLAVERAPHDTIVVTASRLPAGTSRAAWALP